MSDSTSTVALNAAETQKAIERVAQGKKKMPPAALPAA